MDVQMVTETQLLCLQDAKRLAVAFPGVQGCVSYKFINDNPWLIIILVNTSKVHESLQWLLVDTIREVVSSFNTFDDACAAHGVMITGETHHLSV